MSKALSSRIDACSAHFRIDSCKQAFRSPIRSAQGIDSESCLTELAEPGPSGGPTLRLLPFCSRWRSSCRSSACHAPTCDFELCSQELAEPGSSDQPDDQAVVQRQPRWLSSCSCWRSSRLSSVCQRQASDFQSCSQELAEPCPSRAPPSAACMWHASSSGLGACPITERWRGLAEPGRDVC